MEDVIENHYPITFRDKDAKELGEYLKNRNSVVLIGMKRVGISNFLRFFLNHKGIVKTYIDQKQNHLFIPVDLNDLVEKEVFPFWVLTFKRIVDAVEKSSLDDHVKKHIETLFLDSIQGRDIFLTIDAIRRSFYRIVEEKVLPTIFFIRFDRIKDSIKPEFFANLQGLKDATNQKLAYVFTSFRSLDKLSPSIFPKASLGVFSNDMNIKPAEKKDTQVIFKTYRSKYKLNLSPSSENQLFNIVDGYVQYLQLSLISLNENKTKNIDLFDYLIKDERIILQSEELWESLSKREQEVILKISKGERIKTMDKEEGKYLWDTGFVNEIKGKIVIFSSLFEHFLKLQELESNREVLAEFTKKENALFSLLEKSINEICEREKIIESVWPEVEELGVSDWAIDRLVARVRNKLKLKKSRFEIQTVKTRGYKLIASR